MQNNEYIMYDFSVYMHVYDPCIYIVNKGAKIWGHRTYSYCYIYKHNSRIIIDTIAVQIKQIKESFLILWTLLHVVLQLFI